MLTDLLSELDFAPGSAAPAVGVSACLVGDAVRYDGTDKFHEPVAGLAGWLTLQGYCPEVGIGLGVPRPAIRILELDGAERVRGVDEPEHDFTDALHGYAGQVDSSIHGYIFKARSPSCGWRSTPVFDEHGGQTGVSSGLFNQGVRERFPEMPFCDEETLLTPAARAAFVLQVYCHRHLSRYPQSAPDLRHKIRRLPPEYRDAVANQLARFDSAPG